MSIGDQALDDDARIAERLRALSASLVADALEGRGGVVSPGLIRFGGQGVSVGRAVTAACERGSLAPVFAALEHARPGDMLCMSAPGDTAHLGDLLAANLVERALTGAVVDGLIRDVAIIAGMPLTVFARGVTPFARRGADPGVSMQTVNLGGVDVSPGDWIVADFDGVVVVRQDAADSVLEKAEELARLEVRIFAHIKNGVSIADAVRRELGPR